MSVDLNHGSNFIPGRAGPVPAPLGVEINRRIDAALVAQHEAEGKRRYLGASMLGDPCARRVAYTWRDAPAEPFDGRALRIFALGHVVEDLLAQWIRAAGFELLTVDPRTGAPFAFRDGAIEGHADGVIGAGPLQALPYPVLWEAKGLNERAWGELVKHGLQASKPLYYGQVVLYMYYFNLGACLFSALNKNTCEIHHELVRPDPPEARRLVDCAARIVAGWLPPRQPSFCEWCRFRIPCWSSLDV